MLNYNTHADYIDSPVRSVYAGVEVYNSSTLLHSFTDSDRLKAFSIDRQGDNDKFFGFGICQRINFKLIDINREIDLSTSNHIRVKMSAVSPDTLVPIGTYFDVYDCFRDENTNALSITCYDKIKKCSEFYTRDLDIAECGSYREYVNKIVPFMGFAGVRYICDETDNLNIFDDGANADLEGTETIRDLLDDIAEATQTIYYLDVNNCLVFRRYSINKAPDYTITKDMYTMLDSGENRRLGTICHTSELGDSVYASIEASGSTQFVRDNCFWVQREDIRNIVESAIAVYGGLTINQFTCSWRGDYRLEIGDKIGIECKDGTVVYSYVLYDTIRYEGGLAFESEWNYKQSDSESASNPTSLGDMLKQTYARVDKANKEIELVASRNDELAEEIAQIKIDTESINLSVSNTQQQLTTFQSTTTEQISSMESSIQANEQKITEAQATTDQKLAEMEESVKADTQEQINQGLAQTDQKIADMEESISANTQEQINQGLAQTDQKLTEMEETISANTQQQITEGLAGTNEQISDLQNSVNQTQQQIADNKAQTDEELAELDDKITDTNEQFDLYQANTNTTIKQITNRVNAQLSPTDVRIEVEKIIAEQGDINSITTATGFTFNESGLNVSKSDSEMSTIISDDGMRIIKNTDVVLTANNVGVDAKNLHATTYLIVGTNSRFEDYDNNTRTGCFWIGD